ITADADDLKSLFHIPAQHKVRRYLIFNSRPYLVAIHERKRKLSAFWPGAQQQPAVIAKSVGRALWIGMVAQIRLKIILVFGEHVAFNLRGVERIFKATHPCNPGSQHTVGQTTLAVLILGPLLPEQLEGLLRILAAHGDS